MRFPSIEKTFLIQLVSSYILVGILLVTQLVIYPMYRILPADAVTTYESSYIIRAFILIGPIMLAELLTAIRLVMKVRNFELHRSLRANMSIIAIIWIITFVFEVPTHYFIARFGYSQERYNIVIIFNFLRLLLWIIKAWIITKLIPHFFGQNQIYNQDFLE